MAQANATEVWAEMARRKVRFHCNEDWDKIRLWGLFQWGEITHYLKSGELITDMRKENKTVWVKPSKDAWEKKIKPLIDQYDIDTLTRMAGW